MGLVIISLYVNYETPLLNVFFGQQQHTANDRSCRKLLLQTDIKKIMAYENVSYKEVVQIKHSKAVNTAFSFAYKVAKKVILKTLLKCSIF